MSITSYMTIEIIQYNGMYLHWSLVQVLFTFFLYFIGISPKEKCNWEFDPGT